MSQLKHTFSKFVTMWIMFSKFFSLDDYFLHSVLG